MNYTLTRHLQRHEYILNSGYVTDRTVVDLGCGFGIGASLFSSVAKFVFAVDKYMDKDHLFSIAPNLRRDKLFFVESDIFDFMHHIDVAVLVEVFEHISNPYKLVEHVASICDYAFFTTPLAKITGKTINPDHIAEYSAEDFDRLIGEKFEILDKVYQNGDLTITKTAEFSGSSFDPGHVVQMVWCRSKNG